MAYITISELQARYKTFETPSWTTVSSDAIFYAEKEVEARLAPVYSVPFSAAHPTVKDLCIDMVYARHMKTNNPKDGQKIYDGIINRIDDIISGKSPIITGSGYLDPSARGGDMPQSTTEDYYPVHSMLGAEDEHTRISEDRIEDLEDARD